MDNKEINNKKLMDEINSLDEEDKKYSITSNKKGIGISTILIIILIIVIIIIAYFNINKDKITVKKALADFGDYIEENEFELFDEDFDDEVYIEELDEKEKAEKEKFEAQKQNLKISKEFRDANKKLGIVLNNQNQEFITDILVEVIFYNAENKPIKIDSYCIDILENNLDYYIIFEETPENFERYEFLITKEFYNLDVKSLKNDVTYEVKDINDEELVITGKNNSANEISQIEFLLIYYDENNNILGVDTIIEYDIRKNGKFKIEGYKGIINDKTYEDIEYARYELVFASAYNY